MDNKFLTGLFHNLKSSFKMLFDRKKLDDIEIAKDMKKAIGTVEKALNDIASIVKQKDNKDITEALESIERELKDKELSVNVEAPIVKVPEPQVKVLQETKEAKKTNTSLSAIAKLLNYIAKRADTTFVENSKPDQAIPVVLTDANRKKFYSAIQQAISTASAIKFPQPNSYPIEVMRGQIPGQRLVVVEGRNPALDLNTEETIWDQGGIYTYLTENTQLYASSTNASDTAVNVLVEGLDEDYKEVSCIVTLNGQNQVELSCLMFRVHRAIVFGSIEPQGDVYIAESDTLTGGVPNTTSKIKAKIIQGRNVTSMGMYTLPAGKSGYGLFVIFVAGKGDNIEFRPLGRLQGQVFTSQGEFELYQQAVQFGLEGRFLPEKAEIEYRGYSGNADAKATVFLIFYLIDN